MQHIIVDLEFAPVKDRAMRKLCRNEVVEIGAVRLNEKYEYVDSFDVLVRPGYSTLSTAFTRLTGITENDILCAPLFDEAMDMFSDWIGSEKFKIYQWSENDRIQIIEECRAKGLEEKHDVFCRKHWIDLQRIFGREAGLVRSISLEKAIDLLSLAFEGRMHRACDDARNTAAILQVITNKDEFNSRLTALRKIMKPAAHTSTLGSLLGDKLAELYSLVEAC